MREHEQTEQGIQICCCAAWCARLQVQHSPIYIRGDFLQFEFPAAKFKLPARRSLAALLCAMIPADLTVIVINGDYMALKLCSHEFNKFILQRTAQLAGGVCIHSLAAQLKLCLRN